MKNEEEAIKGTTDNANCSVLGHTNTQCGDGDHQSDEMNKDINTFKANDRTDKVNTQAKDVSSKKTVCRYFLRQECRHGVSGKDCKFDHPKLCYKFIRNGSKHGGCKKQQCNFFHPRLCQSSQKERKCVQKSCKLYHLKGTKRENDIDDVPVISRSAMHYTQDNRGSKSGSPRNDSYSRALYNGGGSGNPVPNTLHRNDDRHSNLNEPNHVDFLLMNKCLQDLIMQVTQLSSLVTNQRREEQCCPRHGQH